MARTKGSDSKLTELRIRKVALNLFSQHGYSAVSMRKIASKADLQVGALYLYTPNKQSLLFDLLKTHMDSLLKNWVVENIEAAPDKRLKIFTKFHIRFHINRVEYVNISYNELKNLTEENFEHVNSLRSEYEKSLEEILTFGRDQGYFDIKDVKLTALAIIAMLNGVLKWYRTDGRLSLYDVEEIYSEMAYKSVMVVDN
jgi:AcrR family transcriptional regulator